MAAPASDQLANRGLAKSLLLLAATVAFLVSPFFVDGSGGFDMAAFPVPQNNAPIIPLPYTFSIWGLIYAWLLLHAGFGALYRTTDPDWDRIRGPLTLSLGVGAGWLYAAQHAPILATVMIWIMLLAALRAAFAVATRRDRWLLQAPIMLYAGWLSAAAFVSLGVVLAGYGWVSTGWGAAMILLPLALLFALRIQWLLQRAPEYGAAIVWALVGIFLANLAAGWAIPVLAALGMLLVGLVMVRALP